MVAMSAPRNSSSSLLSGPWNWKLGGRYSSLATLAWQISNTFITSALDTMALEAQTSIALWYTRYMGTLLNLYLSLSALVSPVSTLTIRGPFREAVPRAKSSWLASASIYSHLRHPGCQSASTHTMMTRSLSAPKKASSAAIFTRGSLARWLLNLAMLYGSARFMLSWNFLPRAVSTGSLLSRSSINPVPVRLPLLAPGAACCLLFWVPYRLCVPQLRQLNLSSVNFMSWIISLSSGFLTLLSATRMDPSPARTATLLCGPGLVNTLGSLRILSTSRMYLPWSRPTTLSR
mmetsp:Transcript_65872/g.208477  ORF Transcript_65872/g.208477 Transcript_65872/m.208477 type:complete len:290 (+) Transcript_65872:177-1046(+)